LSGLRHQHGGLIIVLKRQYGCRNVIITRYSNNILNNVTLSKRKEKLTRNHSLRKSILNKGQVTIKVGLKRCSKYPRQKSLSPAASTLIQLLFLLNSF